MTAARPVGQKQFLDSLLYSFRVDGSVVTTDEGVSTGLLSGQHTAYVKKGASADSNLVTITLRKPFGMTEAVNVLCQTDTVDCRAVVESVSKTVITIRTLAHSNLATKADDADFRVFVFGTPEIREGNY